MARSVAALFDTTDQAHRAVSTLRDAGFDESRIGLVAPDNRNGAGANETGPAGAAGQSTEDAVAGGVIGGTAGAILAATGALVIPGIGPFISAGILATALVGGAAGWLVGGLTGLGLSREHAEHYQQAVEGGRTLVTVNVDSDARDEEARDLLVNVGADEISSSADGTTMTPVSGAGATTAATTAATLGATASDPALAGATGMAAPPPFTATTDVTSDMNDVTSDATDVTSKTTGQTRGERVLDFTAGEPAATSEDGAIARVEDEAGRA